MYTNETPSRADVFSVALLSLRDYSGRTNNYNLFVLIFFTLSLGTRSLKDLTEQLTGFEKRFVLVENRGSELVSIQAKLDIIVSKLAAWDTLTQDVSDIKAALDFNNFEIEALRKNSNEAAVERKSFAKDLDNLTIQNQAMKTELSELRKKAEENDYNSRKNNLIIRNVPCLQNENLVKIASSIFAKCNCTLKDSDFQQITRFKGNTKKPLSPGLVLISFRDAALRERILSTARKCKITIEDIGMGKSKDVIFIAEDLSPYTSGLFAAARECNRKLNWRFAWCKAGKIFMRKEETSTPILVKDFPTLEKLTSDIDALSISK